MAEPVPNIHTSHIRTPAAPNHAWQVYQFNYRDHDIRSWKTWQQT